MAKKNAPETTVDGDTEDLAYLLTHIIGTVDPLIDYGVAYEAIVRFLVKLIDGETVTEQDAFACGKAIMATRSDSDRQLH